jgi:hypothetical protein
MDIWPLFAAGMLLIALAVVDVVWTVVASARGSGPFTHLFALTMWKLLGRRGGSSHRALEFLGYGILLGIVLSWVASLWLGLTLAFLSDPDAVLGASSQQPASAVARAGYAMGSLAGAGAAYIAGSGGWVLLNNAGAVLGLGVVTLTLTYLFQVVGATSHKRALALQILGIADTPAALARIGLGRPQLGVLGSQLMNLSSDVALLARYHLVLPVLDYLHFGQRTAEIEVALAVLDDTLTIVETAAPQDCRGITPPLRQAIREYLDTAPLAGSHVETPPMPDLGELADLDVPDQQCFQQAFDGNAQRRRQLRGLVERSGWQWQPDTTPAGPSR